MPQRARFRRRCRKKEPKAFRIKAKAMNESIRNLSNRPCQKARIKGRVPRSTLARRRKNIRVKKRQNTLARIKPISLVKRNDPITRKGKISSAVQLIGDHQLIRSPAILRPKKPPIGSSNIFIILMF